ncbi:MAG: PEGA domain-containing protein [Kofleriaceae bacterium]
MKHLIIALLLVSSVARADDKAAQGQPRSSAEGDAKSIDKAAGERYFRAGAKAYAAQNFAAAVANFDEAFKALPMPEIAFSAAQAYRRLYRIDPQPQFVRRSVELYRIYLDKVKTGGRVGDAGDSLGEMERELEKLEAKGAKTRVASVEHTRLGVNISIADQGADAVVLREIGEGIGGGLAGVKATLDGKPVEPYALIEVSAGDHVVTVAADGYFPVEKKQRAVQGASSLVEVELQPMPAKVMVKTEAGARITVDGRAGTSALLELAAGKHVVAVTRLGREAWGREITVTRGQSLTVTAPLVKTGRRRAVPWVAGGAGVLGFAALATTVGAFVANSKAGDLRDSIDAGNASPGTGDDYDTQVRRRDDLRTSAVVFGGAALVTGAIGFALYYFDRPSAETIQIAPVAGPTGGGISASGRF